MSGYQFSHIPVRVPRIETRFRRIATDLPVPESLQVFEDLDRYECRSMHGQYPIVWDRARDFQVWDRFGNCWIDFTSTIFVTNSGHSNPLVNAALREMLEKDLLHSYTFATEIRARYLRRLIGATPPQLEKAFLLSSGTEAAECAIKLLRMHGQAQGKRHGGIISFEDSMHGRTMGAQMLGGNPGSRGWIGYQDPHIHRMPFPYPWTLHEKGRKVSGEDRFHADIERLLSQGVDPASDLSGFILESYIGWGAVFFPDDYVRALFRWAREHGLPVVFDDIQGGFGRTGKLFSYQHYGVEPEMVLCGKGISSSLPLSAVIGHHSIMDLPDVGSMSSTHSANPLACAAGLANLEAIESMNLIREAARKGEILFRRLRELQAGTGGRIQYVLGKGLVAALIVVDPDTRKPDPEIASRVCEKAMQKGLLLVHTGRESIKMGPPLTISDEALLEALDVLEECFREVSR
jgi:4-aminobutyrate aminotransferase-like enzyme